MKSILIGGIVLMLAWAGVSEPGAAVPLRVITAATDTQSSLVVPVRHHRHHHRHGRNWRSRGPGYGEPYSDSAAIEGQGDPAPGYPAAQAAPATALPTGNRSSRAGTAATRPSIRWIDPDNPVR
jgi:hypothetical protein